MTALPESYGDCKYKYEHVEMRGGVLDSRQAKPPPHVARVLAWTCGVWAKQISVGNLWYPSESIFYQVWKKGQGIVTNGPSLPDPEKDDIGMKTVEAIRRLPSFTMMEILEECYFRGHNDAVGSSEMYKRYGYSLPKYPTHDELDQYEKKLQRWYQQYRRIRENAEWALNEPLKPMDVRLKLLCVYC